MLETRNVFVDTSTFIEQNYSFHGAVFQNLLRLCANGQAKVFVTDITYREVIAHIEEDIAKACQACARLQRDARILRNLPHPPFVGLFERIDPNSTTAELILQFKAFLERISTETLSTSSVSIESVFDKYFLRKPPFGEGKKKDEFPDAFSLQALENWCEAREELMYVVSADGDMPKHCAGSKNLLHLQKLAEFINVVEFHDEVLAPSVDRLLEANAAAIEDAITNEFVNQGFWIEDQDGDVNGVDVKHLECLDRLVLEIDKNSAVVQVDTSITFEADIIYDDLDTASYDSEDKVLIPWQQINKVVEQTETVIATVYIKHDVEEPGYFEIDRVEIDTGQRFGFGITADDEWPYK
jgi:hypothetical protein